MKKTIIAMIWLVALSVDASPQITILGNCGSNITGIRLSTGDIYCIVPPSCVGTGFDFSLSCNSQYLSVF